MVKWLQAATVCPYQYHLMVYTISMIWHHQRILQKCQVQPEKRASLPKFPGLQFIGSKSCNFPWANQWRWYTVLWLVRPEAQANPWDQKQHQYHWKYTERGAGEKKQYLRHTRFCTKLQRAKISSSLINIWWRKATQSMTSQQSKEDRFTGS